MKKKILSILCVLVLLVGVLGLGSAVSASNDIGNLKVGYAVISIDPVDKEGTYRTIDYTSIYNGSGNASLKADIDEMITSGDSALSYTMNADGTMAKVTYTVQTLAVDCDNDGNTNDGYFSVPLGGYGSTDGRLSTGKMDDNGDGVIDSKDGSFITCIAVTDQNDHTMLFFSMDLISAGDYTFAVREEIKSALAEADSSYVVLSGNMTFSASHTHSSPDTGINNSYALPINAAQRAYEDLLIAKTKEVAIAAMADRTEVTVSSGEVEATNMNATRHYTVSEKKQNSAGTTTYSSASWVYGDNFGGSMPEDKYVMNGTGSYTSGSYKYEISASNVSESNDTLQLVQFTPTNGDDPIVMVNFRSHPKTNSTATTRYGLDNRSCNSGDYAVMLREKLNAFGYRASFIQGAAGNQNTFNYLDDSVLGAKVTNTTPGTAMYNEIMAYRVPDGTTTADCYNDRMSFIKYTSPTTGTTTNVQTGYSYGARLADYALLGLKNNMTAQDNGTVKVNQTFYLGDGQFYSEGLTAAAIYYKETLGQTSGKLKYYYEDPDTSDGDASGYYNINSIYHANAVYSRRNMTVDSFDTKLELNIITIGPLAFVTAPNELYDRYNYDGDQINNNLWDVFNAAANGAGYITPIVLGYTNGAEGYIPNVAAYEYNQANNDAGSIVRPTTNASVVMGVGAYEANTSKFASGSGEQIIEHFQAALLSMETESRPLTCPMCGEENVQWEALWDPNTTQLYGGHYYLSDDLEYFRGRNAFQRTIHADSCIDLNGFTAGNSSTATGRAFNVVSGATLRLMNGTVKGRGMSNGTNGGVIILGSGSSLYMNNVDVIREVYDGQTTSSGGVIYASSNCTVQLKDTTITGGVSTASGGNLYMAAGGTLDLENVTMTGGSADGTGDNMIVLTPNVHIYGDSVLQGESYFSSGDYATTKISGNVQAYGSPDGVNIKLAMNTRLTFGELSDTAKISVQGTACITDTTGLQYAGKQLVADNGFYLDTSFTTRGVFVGDKWMCECGGLAADKHTCQYHAYTPWSGTASLPTVGNFYLTDNVTMTAQGSPNDTYKTLRIDLAGHSITHKVTAGSTTTRVFTVGAGELLTLTDTVGGGVLTRDLSNLTTSQQKSISNYGLGVCLASSNAVFNMYGGTIDCTGQTTTGGGAVAGTVGATTINIYGGTIYGASATYGSCVFSKGAVNLYGGLLTGGKSNSGAVYMTTDTESTVTPMLTLTGDASVTGNYLSSGTVCNLKVSSSYLTISGTYTGTAGVTVSNPKNGTVVAISDNARLSNAALSVDGNSTYYFVTSGNSVVLTDTLTTVVKDADGNTYYTMQEAVEACAESGAMLTLLDDIAEDITVPADLTVDLAGFDLTGTVSYTGDAKLIVKDSNTDDYTVEDGNGYGTVPYSANVVAADGYLLHTENDVTSAHAYDVRLTSVAQRARVVGMYFGSCFQGDEIVKELVSGFGVSLRINQAPDAAYILADTAGKTHTSRSQSDWVVGQNEDDFYGTVVENVMLPGNGYAVNSRNANIPVFGLPYIKLTDGSFLFGSAYSFTLKELTELSDDQTLTETQLSNLADMYAQYKSVMADWDIPQIKAAYLEANPYAEKTVSFVGDSITYGIKVNDGEQYWNHLQTNLDLGEVTNHGVSGSCYSTYNDRGTDYQPLVNRYQNIEGTDLIVIFMGTNDFSHETPLGTTADTTDISLCGAMNIVLNGLKEAHPDSQIVLLTPIQRYDMTTNDIGLTLEDYVNTIKTVGEYHDIPVLDLYTPSLTQLPVEYMDATDKVHPTADGHVILADMIKTLLEENETSIFG